MKRSARLDYLLLALTVGPIQRAAATTTHINRMKLKPRPREGAPADLKREPAPRSGLARRLSVGLRRRVSGFARTGTDDMSSDGEDPAASPRPPAPAAPPSSAAIPAAPVGRGGDARAPPAVSLPVASNLDDVDGPAGGALAREVGTNAQEYLDECFYTEGPVVARDKFEAVPQLAVADLTILVSRPWQRDVGVLCLKQWAGVDGGDATAGDDGEPP